MLISGLEGHICENCAEQAFKIVEQELGIEAGQEQGPNLAPIQEIPSPKSITDYLDVVIFYFL